MPELKSHDERFFNQLTEVVAKLGTKAQKERWAEGFMARSEALELHGKSWDDRLAIKYPILQPICKCCGYRIDNFVTTDKKTLTDTQWEAFKMVRQAFHLHLPNVTLLTKQITFLCVECRRSEKIVFATATWVDGVIEVTRSYVLGEVQEQKREIAANHNR